MIFSFEYPSYDGGKQMDWTADMIKRFLKLRIMDNMTQAEIAKDMGLRLTQIKGVQKNFKAGKYDDLIKEMMAESTAVPAPQPVPSPVTPAVAPPVGDEYSPEGNVDDTGVSSDPPCKTVFSLVSTPDDTPLGSNLDRMKRRAVFTSVKPGRSEPYTLYVSWSKYYEDLDVKEAPENFMVFDGKIELDITGGVFTTVPTPSPKSLLVSEYSLTDNNTGLAIKSKMQTDELGVWYITALEDIRTTATLAWRVACPLLSENYWSPATGLPNYGLPQKQWFRDGLDRSMHSLADEMIDHLGIKRGKLGDSVVKLGRYCASFGCGRIPDGDMVWESFFNKVGACRHRALDFFIVALRRGIACRYVVSDCHAFVELFDPVKNIWIALDLGGCDPGGPRNPDDLNPPEPEEPPPVSELPERPEERLDIRDDMRKAGMTDVDIRIAYNAWKASGGR
jgi:hypothetical protein